MIFSFSLFSRSPSLCVCVCVCFFSPVIAEVSSSTPVDDQELSDTDVPDVRRETGIDQ